MVGVWWTEASRGESASRRASSCSSMEQLSISISILMPLWWKATTHKDALKREDRRLTVSFRHHLLSHLHQICVLRFKKAADIYRNEPSEPEQIPPVLQQSGVFSFIQINGLFGSQLMSSRHQTCTETKSLLTFVVL